MATSRLDHDRLMMEALDGTLDAAGRAALEAHFARRPDERREFERMLEIESALRAVPPATPPAHLAHTIMRAVAQNAARAAAPHPALNGQQAGLIIVACGLLLLTGAVAAVAASSLLMPTGPDAALQALRASGSQALAASRDTAAVGLAFAKVLFAQPLAWLAVVLSLSIVAVWLSVIARAWQPDRRLAQHPA